MSKTHLLQGKARYAKIVGRPVPAYDEGQFEWTFDLVLDKKAETDYLATGADPFYIKERDGVRYVRFQRKAEKKDGEPAKPISIIDHAGREWDDRLIGNDSVLNVALALNESVYKGKKRLKPAVLSVQVWELKSYKPKSSFPTRPDAPAEENVETTGTAW